MQNTEVFTDGGVELTTVFYVPLPHAGPGRNLIYWSVSNEFPRFRSLSLRFKQFVPSKEGDILLL